MTIAGQTVTVTQGGVVQANDVGITGFESPSAAYVHGAATIRVRVANFGSNPQSDFPVSYQIGNAAPVTETYVGTLMPLQTATKTFTTT